MPVMDTTCMETVLKNPTASSKKYLFLPKNQQFDPMEEKTFFGDIAAQIMSVCDDGETAKRRIKAFENAVKAGDLVIVKLPNPLLQDTATDTSYILKITSGTIGKTDPCFNDSV